MEVIEHETRMRRTIQKLLREAHRAKLFYVRDVTRMRICHALKKVVDGGQRNFTLW